MLPPFIIDQLREREERARDRDREQPRLELPLPVSNAQRPESADKGDRGIVEIQIW